MMHKSGSLAIESKSSSTSSSTAAAMLPEMQAHVDGFLEYLRVEKGSARNTVEAYQGDLQKFCQFLEKQGWTVKGAGPTGVRK